MGRIFVLMREVKSDLVWVLQGRPFSGSPRRTVVFRGHWSPVIKNIVVDFPGGPVVKNVPVSAGETGSVPGLGRFYTRGN